MATDDTLEKPLVSPRPSKQLPGDASFGSGFTGFDTSGEPLIKAPKRVKPFNELAKDFDPMMDQKTYDALRNKYFDDHVIPLIPKGFSVYATRTDFMKRTERKHLLTGSQASQAQTDLFMTSFSQPMAQSARSIVDLAKAGANFLTGDLTRLHEDPMPARQMERDFQARREQLHRVLERDGYNAAGPDIVGAAAGDLTGFLAVEAATGGVGGIIEGAAFGARAARTASLVSKMTKGGVAFGTYAALTNNGQDRGYAFAKGAALGAAFDGALSVGGRFLRRGKMTPEQIEKEVTNALDSDPPKKMSTQVDAAVAETIARDQAQARQAGLPQVVRVDNSSRKIRVMGTDGRGAPFTVQVEPGAEGRAVEQIRAQTANGGSIQGMLFHEDEAAGFNRFAHMLDDSIPKVDTRVVRTAPGTAGKVSAQMRMEGVDAEPVGDSKVHVDVPKPKLPSIADLTADLSQHDLPDGTKLSKGEVADYARRIHKLWHPGTLPQSKEAIAQDLAGRGLDDFIPEEWRRKPGEIKAEEWEPDEAPEAAAGELTERESEAERIFQETIAERERQVSPAAKVGDFVEGQPLPSGFHLEEPERPSTSPVKGVSAKMAADPMYQKAAELFDKGMSLSNVQRELGLPAGKTRSYMNAWNRLQKRAPAGSKLRAFDQHVTERTNLSPQDVRRRDPKMVSEAFFDDALRYDPTKERDEIRIRHRGQKTNIQVPSYVMGKLTGDPWGAFTGNKGSYDVVMDALGVQGTPQWVDRPVMVYTQAASRQTVWHEGVHAGIDNVVGFEQIHTMLDKNGQEVTTDIANELSTEPGYEAQSHETRQEEAFVYAAEAIRFQNLEGLRAMANMDTSVAHVVDMVDKTSENLLLHSLQRFDSQRLRAFQESMRDLMRRTGKDRLERWLEDADRAGWDLHYDAEKDAFIAHDGSRLTEIPKEASVADFISEASGADQVAPNITQALELGGIRGRFTGTRGGPGAVKRMPMPELVPTEDRSRGILAMTSLWRPAQDWFASVDKFFTKNGMTDVKIFDRFKKLDDGVRIGSQWLTESLHTASTFLKGDANRLKTMFEFLSADPKHWERMLPRFNMDRKFLSDVTEANKWLEKYRDETGVQVFNYLRRDLPQLRGFGYETNRVWGADVKSTKEMSFFRKAIAEGDLNPRDGHAGRFINFLIRSGYEKKYLAEAVTDMNRLLDMKDAGGKSVLGVLKWPVQNYVNYVRGIPDSSQQIMTKVVGDFQKHLGVAMREINKVLPGKYKLPEEFNYPGTAVNKLMGLSYAAGIGLRPIIPVRDALQVLTNTLPILGPKKFAEGMSRGLTADGWREAMEAGALLGRHTTTDLYGDIFQELPPGAGGTLDKALELSNKLLAPSRWGHNAGRAIAYHGELNAARRAINAYRRGDITIGKLFDDTSLWFFPEPLQTRFTKDIMGGASADDVAKQIALETVDSTLWPYRRGTQPAALRTGVGRIFGQYGLWPLNYMEYLKKLAVKSAMGDHKHNAMMAAGMWLAANTAGYQALSSMGADVGKWFFVSPAGYSGGPHLELAQSIMKAAEESDEGRAARKKVLEYPLNFIPGSVEAQAILKAMEADEPMFDSSGKPTKALIRILGMRPKADHMQDLTPEEWLQYEAGFKQRGGRNVP